MADSVDADAAANLAGLAVRFAENKKAGGGTWRLGCDAKRVAEAGWTDGHDKALSNALRALEALQGLPSGPKARDANAWLRAQAQLRFVRAELAAPSFKPDRGRDHKCSPGYDCVGCKQARAPAPSLSAATLFPVLPCGSGPRRRGGGTGCRTPRAAREEATLATQRAQLALGPRAAPLQADDLASPSVGPASN